MCMLCVLFGSSAHFFTFRCLSEFFFANSRYYNLLEKLKIHNFFSNLCQRANFIWLLIPGFNLRVHCSFLLPVITIRLLVGFVGNRIPKWRVREICQFAGEKEFIFQCLFETWPKYEAEG